MDIKKFNQYTTNESLSMKSKASTLDGEFKLYRLTSHSVIDLASPGEYYVYSKNKLDISLLKNKKKDDLYLITVKCDSSNVDIDKSEKECAKLDNSSIIIVKDDNKCELVSVEPFDNIKKSK